MENKTSFTEITRVTNNAIGVIFSLNNVAVKIRISYLDRSRKNAIYKDYKVHEIFITALVNEDRRAEELTDIFLFIERKKQWILEAVIRQQQAQINE